MTNTDQYHKNETSTITMCSKCNDSNVVFSRKYSGERLCGNCFSNSIFLKTSKTILKYNMMKRNDHVCVAVSGGKDSLVLLYILNKISNKLNCNINAVTIDEGISGYREESLMITRNFCNKLGIEHKIYSYKDLFDLTLDDALDLRTSRISSCSICGILRRRAIDYAAKDINCDIIATGHNLDDMVQTFLINMISGDVDKIGFMYPETNNFPRRIKPFCEIYESEIVFFAFINGIPFQSESCPHMNEGIRTEIREFINSLENEHNGIKNNLFRSTLKIAQTIGRFQHKQRRSCYNCGSLCTSEICSVCNITSKIKKT